MDTTPPVMTSRLTDVRNAPLRKAEASSILDRLRPEPNDDTKPAVAAFNASL
jgi:hypothetical protein